MSFLITNKVQLETQVEFTGLKDEIDNVNTAKFGNNIEDFLDHMQSLYEDILQKNASHNEIVLHTFRALKTASKLDFLRTFCTRTYHQEIGKIFTFDMLNMFTVKKYNNLLTENAGN